MGGVILAGCGSSQSSSITSRTCGRVARAEHLQAQADATSGPAAHKLGAEATRQLDLAEPLASLEAGGNGSWQALMMTLLETHQVPTPVLLPALKADCANLTQSA